MSIFEGNLTQRTLCCGAGGTVLLAVPLLAWNVFTALVSLGAAPQHSAIVLSSALVLYSVVVEEWEDTRLLLCCVAGRGRRWFGIGYIPVPHRLLSTVVHNTIVPGNHLPSLHLGGAPCPVRIHAVIPSTLAVLLVIVLEGELAVSLTVGGATNCNRGSAIVSSILVVIDKLKLQVLVCR